MPIYAAEVKILGGGGAFPVGSTINFDAVPIVGTVSDTHLLVRGKSSNFIDFAKYGTSFNRTFSLVSETACKG